MLRQETLKKEFFRYLNKSVESVSLISSLKDQNNLNKHIGSAYKLIKGKDNLDETELNNILYESMKLNRRIELYLDQNGRDYSLPANMRRRQIPTYESYKKLEIKKRISLENWSGEKTLGE